MDFNYITPQDSTDDRTLTTPDIFDTRESPEASSHQPPNEDHKLIKRQPRRSHKRFMDQNFIKFSLKNMVRETKTDRGLTLIKQQLKPISHQAMVKFEEAATEFMRKLSERSIAFAELRNENVVSPTSMQSAANSLNMGIETFFNQFLVPREDGSPESGPRRHDSLSPRGC